MADGKTDTSSSPVRLCRARTTLSCRDPWYADRLHGYDRVYGSLGAVVGFMTWTWLSCAAVLLGAVVHAEAERQTARDTTAGSGAPPGERGARAADAVVLRGE